MTILTTKLRLLGSLSVQRTPNILAQKRTNICYRFVGCIPRPRICITIMVDYIVPAVLQQLGVLKYSSKLAKLIVANNEIDSSSEEEVKLWTCSIYAVERMKELISKKSGKQVLSVELDLWLWSFGIQFPSLQHH
ncbi:uncharacterized protein LOC107410449 [Ziziphus jujuba]|uniref:Queuosine 5'-phosphate N-glycosylase/hydrolase n=1 Tax=Ziziphus jujuba TaxID=326968 RepID=A0ABM3ZUT6_ZIZJJ|nr:uncharacterized protein LOC107410449 [Ziziphus jujuba]XP_060668257.1 uncharacterized protein LOC107410449 [Ziziphus jujuba]